MAVVGLFFGSDEGNTLDVSNRIQKRLGEDVVDIHDIAEVTQLDFTGYDKLILGIPTWDFGQLQSDWEEFWGELESMDFTGKTVALFGLGDQFGYGDYFIDAVGMLHDVLVPRGAKIIGHWPCDEDYEFDESKALIEGEDIFVGLAIDEDQQPDMTAERLDLWCQQIHTEFALSSPLHTVVD